MPTTGEYDKARLKRLFDRMLSALDDRGLQMRIVGLVAEGDTVAAEAESTGDLKNGRQYRQQYHFMIRFRDGKIARVHEYLDTHHAFEVWIKPQS
jgi:ketosteroid isomerase-like protein